MKCMYWKRKKTSCFIYISTDISTQGITYGINNCQGCGTPTLGKLLIFSDIFFHKNKV